MALKAIVFDLDGVLLDTERVQFDAWRAALGEHQVDLSAAVYSRVAGLQSDAIASLFVQDYRIDITPEDLQGAKAALLDAQLHSGAATLLPHAIQTLDAVGARFPLGLATGGSRSETGIKLETTGLAPRFKAIVTRSDVAHGKPHPDLYRRAAVLLGVDPAEALAVEDTPAGVAAAKAAGLRCVAVPGEFTKGQDFSAADQVVESLLDVQRAVGQL